MLLTCLALPCADAVRNLSHLQALAIEAGEGVAVGDELAICLHLVQSQRDGISTCMPFPSRLSPASIDRQHDTAIIWSLLLPW